MLAASIENEALHSTRFSDRLQVHRIERNTLAIENTIMLFRLQIPIDAAVRIGVGIVVFLTVARLLLNVFLINKFVKRNTNRWMIDFPLGRIWNEYISNLNWNAATVVDVSQFRVGVGNYS